MSRLLAIAGILATLAVVACGDDDAATTTAAAPAADTAESASQEVEGEQAAGAGKQEEKQERPEPAGTEIKIAESQFGPILFDGEDQAIYLFDKETASEPDCYGGCAAAWPPVLTDGNPAASSGAEAKLLGTTERDDGSTQVTYNGHPLYYYAHEGPGEVLCGNVDEFGGLWLVVDAAGNAVS